MGLKTYGTMAVDWEQRVDIDRLRTRAARAREASCSPSRSSARCSAST